MPIVLNGSGTVTGISVGGLPDGCVDTDTLATSVTRGKILQVVTALKTNTASQGSATYASISGLQPTITPTASTSKILININIKIGASHQYADVNLKLYRSVGGSELEIFSGTNVGNRTAGFYGVQDFHQMATYFQIPCSSQYLDEPNTDQQITYLMKWQVTRGGTYIYVNRTGDDTNDSGAHRLSSSITLTEVAA